MKKLFFLLPYFLVSPSVAGQGYCDKLQFCSHSSSNITIEQVKSFFSDNAAKLSTENSPKRIIWNIGYAREALTPISPSLHSKKVHRKEPIDPNGAKPKATPGNIYGNSMLNVPSQNHILENANTPQRIVNRILCLANNPDISINVKTNNKCYNAAAVHCREGNYIFYNTDYFKKAMNSADSSIVYGIFAHEVGHLIRGDAWLGGHEAELNADKFAGHIMGLMNFPQKITVESLNGVEVNITKTHPAKIKREAAMAEGWLEGQINRREINSSSLAYLMECKSEYNNLFEIKYLMQGKSKKKKGFYNIACQIGGTSEKLKTIKNVTYYLHPSSFENNSVKYMGNQILSLEIWGSFELRASVVCEEDGVENEYSLQENLIITDGKGRSVSKADVPGVYIDNINASDQKVAKLPLVPLMKGVNFPANVLRPSKGLKPEINRPNYQVGNEFKF